MFQCIIQQRNGWIHAPNPETRDVFPGNCSVYFARSYTLWFSNYRLLITGLFLVMQCVLLFPIQIIAYALLKKRQYHMIHINDFHNKNYLHSFVKSKAIFIIILFSFHHMTSVDVHLALRES